MHAKFNKEDVSLTVYSKFDKRGFLS